MRLHSPTLDDVLVGRDNNLNVIRMVAASLVMVSHAFPIAHGEGAEEPLFTLTGATLGHFSVAVFFGLSGLLIARSFDRRRNLAQFLTARVLRIFPALAVVLILTVFFGAWFTQLPLKDYFLQRETWSYVPANLSLAFMQFALPGVFLDNPYGSPINGSLWTLFYEVACYGAVVVLGICGGLRDRFLALAALILVSILHLTAPMITGPGGIFPPGISGRIELFAMLAFPFMLGVFAYVWRIYLPLSGWIAVILWVPVLFMTPGLLMESMIVTALIYSTFWFGFVPKGRLIAYNRLGDYSYGVYIYAFPVQQSVAYLVPGITPLGNIALAAPVTLTFAVLSWHLIEARALAAVGPLTDAFMQRSRKPA